mmetsp:Transcript_24961/g.34250  ORF Transcript_24961/g.34250 Transcript_24961/m.34250 type:complete len:204 (-) Transcript_24961:215-826(-)
MIFVVCSVVSHIQLRRRIRTSNAMFSKRIEKVQDAISNLSGYNYLRDVTTMIENFRDELVFNGWDVQLLSVRNIYDKNGDRTMEFTESLIGKRRAHEPVRVFLLHTSQYLTKKELETFLNNISTFEQETVSFLDTKDTNVSILYRMMANRIATFSPNRKGLKVVPVILSPHIDIEAMQVLESKNDVSYVTAKEGGFKVILKNI